MRSATLSIPKFISRTGGSPLKRHLVGAVRYEFEVRLHSIADIKVMFRGLLSPDQVQGILLKNYFPGIPAKACSLAWLLKQKEKNHATH